MVFPGGAVFPMLSAWGKTDPHTGDMHHLAHHCADVAAVFRVLLQRSHTRRAIRSALGRDLSQPEQGALAVMAFLHDIGKLAPAFQAKGWPNCDNVKTCGHLEAGQHWLRMPHSGASLGGQMAALAEMCGTEGQDWFAAIFAHHGRPLPAPNEARANGCFQNFADYNWKNEETILGSAIAAWFPDLNTLCLPPAVPELVHYITGLLALAD